MPDRSPCDGGTGGGGGTPILAAVFGGRGSSPPPLLRPLPKSSQPGIILLCRYITAEKYRKTTQNKEGVLDATVTAREQVASPCPRCWGHREEAICASHPTPGHILLSPSPSLGGSPSLQKVGSPPKYPPKWGCHAAGEAKVLPRPSPNRLSHKWGTHQHLKLGEQGAPKSPPEPAVP